VDAGDNDPNALPIVRRKTLQLNFRKIGDRFKLQSSEIQFAPPAEWIYRPSQLRIPTAKVKQP